jgi:phosphoribosylformimino-5-aminoimidazole carboxamide ribotide isomerase
MFRITWRAETAETGISEGGRLDRALAREPWVDVIPVIDLKDGAVVRARLGRRDSYAPIETGLSQTSDPLDVVSGLLALHAFRTIYVADLDAIESNGDHEQCLSALSSAFPGVTFWVDAGVGDAAEARSWLSRHLRHNLVLGSETLRDTESLGALKTEGRIILSLDFRGDHFLGPEALLAAPHLWPSRVIVMTLGRVGGNAGPDLDRLASIRGKAASIEARIYAAGGVRGRADLASLADAGAAGVLVASALHDGLLTRDDLAAAGDAARTE